MDINGYVETRSILDPRLPKKTPARIKILADAGAFRCAAGGVGGPGLNPS